MSLKFLNNEKFEESDSDGAAAGAPAPQAAPGAADLGLPPEPADESNLSFDDVEKILQFDPFAKKEPEAGAAAPSPGTTPASPTQGAPAPAQPAATPAAAPAANPEVELLRQQLTEAQNLIKSLSANGGQPPATPGTPAAPAEPQIPDYTFTLPPQLLAMLDSENPTERHQAIGAVMTGTARAVHTQVMGMVQQQLGELLEALPSMMAHHVQQHSVQREIFQDFYGKYKDLNDPVLRPMIAAMTRQVMTETGAKAWNEKLRDTIATRVYQVLGRPMPGAAPSAPPAPYVAGGPPARSAAPGTSQADDIARTLGLA